MATTFQQQSLRRKLLYFILIVVLLTVSYGVRHADFTLSRTRVSGIVAQARKLDLREQDQGEADLAGSTLNLVLTGSRGLVVCALWWGTDELKERHEWNDLEQSITVITKLQPHFITPWLFQSHNLAYNVSWESERLRDKYFYIARGIELLADGERRNRDNPDLRQHLGWYYLHKIGFADQSRTFRCLLQLSCSDPIELDRARFFPNPDDPYTVDLKTFEKFCRAHPFLVRRLREGLHLETPREVVDFLLENKKIPNRFQARADSPGEAATPLRPPGERFPILPPRSQFDPDDVTDDRGDLPDDFNNFEAARAWFGYAQDPLGLPPPHTRLPRLNLFVFCGFPARSQAFRAEYLQEEGWFDEDGWELAGWFPQDENARHGPWRTITVGDHVNWAGDAWDRAYHMYREYGEKTGLLKVPAPGAARYALRPEYNGTHPETNYGHFLTITDVERTRPAVTARKYFFRAEWLRLHTAEVARVLNIYEHPAAFGPPSTWDRAHATGWKRLLLDHEAFRRDQAVQEEAYELQHKYLSLVRKGRKFKQQSLVKAVSEMVFQGAAAPQTARLWSPSVPPPLKGPFDDVDDQNEPLIGPEAVTNARLRLGLPVVSRSNGKASAPR